MVPAPPPPATHETVTELVQRLGTALAEQPKSTALAPTDDLTVTDEVTFTRVGIIIQGCATEISNIESRWKDVKAGAFANHKLIVAKEKGEIAPFEKVKATGTSNMLTFRRRQEQERRDVEAAEQRRVDAERLRLLQEERAKDAERLRLEQAARDARRDGDIRQSKELAAQAAVVTQEITQVQDEAASVTEEAVYVPPAKVEGIGERRPWGAEVFDANLLIKAVAEGKFPLMHLIPQRGGPDKMVPIIEINQAVIDHYARRQQDSMAIPGCRAVQGFGFSVKKG